MGIKITASATTKVIRKGPGGETTITTTETSPSGGQTTVTTTQTAPFTIACPQCGGQMQPETALCPHCGTNWRGKKHFTFQTQQKITVSDGSIKKVLFILLLMALAGAAVFLLGYLK